MIFKDFVKLSLHNFKPYDSKDELAVVDIFFNSSAQILYMYIPLYDTRDC